MTRTLQRLPLALALSAAVALSSAAGGASAAVAKLPGVRTCPPQTAPCTVRLPVTFPPLGGVVGTVDKAGSSPALIPWTVTQGGRTVCRGTYRPVDPPQLWTCRLTSPAPATFSTPGLPGPTTIVVRAVLALDAADPTTTTAAA